ncbi:hypothetical protein B0T16DRAFT_395437 [Cercophora newfieldiana]|uniref:Heterokaryon incompatibility domain-containing protein n=1 Tax=Cercophora newfieldiana TaxID=92897 RepID=A0AA40CI73_9PEZI|nr:hypothetical protein B0T16DRAFT_395437 [Cercophora newfieldiana]
MMRDIYTATEEALLWLGEEPSVPIPTVSPDQSQAVDTLILQVDEYLSDLVSTFDTWQDTDVGPLASSLRSSLRTNTSVPGPDTFRIGPTRPHTWRGDELDIDRISKALDPSHPDSTPQDDPVFHAFALFRFLADRETHLDSIPYLTLEPDSHQTILTHARRAVHYLTTLPWWSRIWTVQECLLPPRATLLYGPVSMPWWMFPMAAKNFERHRNTCCAGVPGVKDMLNLQVESHSIMDLRE